MADEVPLTVAIPTYGREEVLLETLEHLFRQKPPPAEILVVDQTPSHAPETGRTLAAWNDEGRVRWIRLEEPSIPRAMNTALLEASWTVVLFLDDDVVPGEGLVAAHAEAHREGHSVVAGQVLQPGEAPTHEPNDGSRFNSERAGQVQEFMAGNVSMNRDVALEVGGFDENFVGAAYRFEADFAGRLRKAGHGIRYKPAASIRHLRAERGGTRAFGHHLRTFRPDHAVGAYYHLLRSPGVTNRMVNILVRPLRAVRTRHHLRRPWYVVVTLIAEVSGMIWAAGLALNGPKLLGERGQGSIEKVGRPA